MTLTPCIKSCAILPSGECAGCGRTREQIRSWGRMSDGEREAAMDELPTGLPLLELSVAARLAMDLNRATLDESSSARLEEQGAPSLFYLQEWLGALSLAEPPSGGLFRFVEAQIRRAVEGFLSPDVQLEVVCDEHVNNNHDIELKGISLQVLVHAKRYAGGSGVGLLLQALHGYEAMQRLEEWHLGQTLSYVAHASLEQLRHSRAKRLAH